jgi:hypothetical protein
MMSWTWSRQKPQPVVDIVDIERCLRHIGARDAVERARIE